MIERSMESVINSENRQQNFFGNGESGAIMRSIDWSLHPLGPSCGWPQSLRTTLSILFSANVPMLLFWGADHFCFYNNAYRSSLGNQSKHPTAPGVKGEEVLTEIWDEIKPRIDEVMQSIKATCESNQLPSVYHNGRKDDVFWKYTCSSVMDETENTAGVLVSWYESSRSISAEQKLKKAYEDKKQILESITDGFIALDKDWTVIYWNKAAEKILGKKREKILGKNLWETYPEAMKLKFYSEYLKTMDDGVSRSFREYFEPLGKWFEVISYPSETGITVYLKDITEQHRLQLINKRTEEISGVAGWEYDVSNNQVFVTPGANDIYGFQVCDMNLETIKKLFTRESVNKIEDALTEAIDHKKQYKIELTLSAADSENKMIEVNGFPFVENGKVTKVYGTLEDITKKKSNQKNLERTNEKLKTTQRIAKIGYWTHDIINNKSDWTDEVYDIWEVDRESFTPTFESLLETVHPDDVSIFLNDVETAFPDQNYYDSEHRIITPEGKVKWILERITLHRDENQAPIRLEGIAQDITERKETQKESEQNRNLFEAIANQTEAAIWVREENGRHFFVNDTWKNIFDLQDQQVVGKTASDLFDTTTSQQFEKNDQRVVESKKPRIFEQRIKTSLGDRFYYTNMFPLTGVPGLDNAVAGISTDITNLKQTEARLQDTEEKLRVIIEHSTNLFYSHTSDHVITFISPQSESFFGYKPKEAMQRWTEFGTDHPVNALGLESTRRAIESGQSQPAYELELRKKNGDIIWVEVNEAPVVKDGKTVSIVGSLTDITDRKQAQMEIADSLKEKEILLAEIHHRVKNNLAVVSGLMLLQSSEEKDEKVTQILHDSISRIKTIANIHEQLYKTDSFSKLGLDENIETLISSLYESMQSGPRITLDYKCEPVLLNINQALPCSLIVNELITNIFKYTFKGRENGNVTIYLTENNNLVKLMIEDNGIGLPDNFKLNKNSSLGLQLVDLLARQLKADYNFDCSGGGTRYTLQFEKSDTSGIANVHL